MPLHPTKYTKLLGENIIKYDINIYLVNTGWVGDAYGVGSRISIKNTRACVDVILDGSILESNFETLDYFNLQIPTSLNGVDDNILKPKKMWDNDEEYMISLETLANKFISNYSRHQSESDITDYSAYGPVV